MKHFLGMALAIGALTSCNSNAVEPGTAVCANDNPQTSTFIEVASGQFVKAKDPIYPEEGRSLRLNVKGFLIQSHEVTNTQFLSFVDATGYITDAERQLGSDAPDAGSAVFSQSNMHDGGWNLVRGATWKTPEGPGTSVDSRMDHPVVHVSLADAAAYSAWAGGRLPSEIEWEYAASLGLPTPEDQTSGAYADNGAPTANTWQGIFPVANTVDDGFAGTSPVGCFGPDKIGLNDMIGNVWEWTDTPFGRGTHTIKGGSYLCANNFCQRYRPAARQPQEIDFSAHHIGFRIVKDLPAKTENGEE